jgi:hypothetical protein
MRFSLSMIDSHSTVVAGASALPAAVAQFYRSAADAPAYLNE